MSAVDVISGKARASVECGDNLPWLQSLPSDCCSLAITSPPYSDARTYSIGFSLTGQQWVDWMIPRVIEMCRVVKGLVCINMSAPVRDHKYCPAVEWLVADLTRNCGIVCGPAPYVYFRFSIPGSGGEHYHRRDHEPVYCFARPENLPLSWSDNTSMGHAPKWAPGGEMSHRLTGGMRINQWGKTGGHESGGQRGKEGKRQRKSRPSHETVPVAQEPSDGLLFEGAEPVESEHNGKNAFGVRTDKAVGTRLSGDKTKNPEKEGYRAKRSARGYKDGDILEGDYTPPATANPGNVVREVYDAEQVRQLLCGGDVGGPVAQGSAGGDVIRCVVGGGSMGANECHDNEAPFSEKLVTFFVRSYAPEDSVVLDPFMGSGTALAVALKWGRRALGCDVRESQCELTRRRLSGLASLFDHLDAPAAGREESP